MSGGGSCGAGANIQKRKRGKGNQIGWVLPLNSISLRIYA